MFEIEIKKKALKYAKKLNKKRKNKLLDLALKDSNIQHETDFSKLIRDELYVK